MKNCSSNDSIINNIKGEQIMAEDFTIENIRNKLSEAYKKYDDALANKFKNGEFEEDETHYSRPYYCGVPDDWCNPNAIRIMIVGKEGEGSWNSDKYKDEWANATITKMQKWNLDYTGVQLEQKTVDNIAFDSISKFWQRFRKIYKELDKEKTALCIWNECDKIHRDSSSLEKNEKCALSARDRTSLHKIKIDGQGILSKEIKILQPDIVIFFGWYGQAINNDQPDMLKKLYPANKWSSPTFRNDFNCIYTNKEKELTVIATYHPSYKHSDEYTNRIVQEIKKNMPVK